MELDVKTRIKRLVPPLLMEAVFVICTLFVVLTDDKRHYGLTLYFMLVFYLALLIYFHRDFSMREFIRSFTSLKGFILPTILTAAGMAAARAVSRLLVYEVFSDYQKITMPLAYSSNVTQTVILAVTVMVLQPFAEELFYRKALIAFESGALLFFTVLAGFFLEAVTRSLTPLGLLEAVIISIPLVIAYCATKNIYVTIFVHFIFNIIVNMPDVIYDFMRMALA